MTKTNQLRNEYYYPIVLKNRKLPSSYSLSPVISIKKLTKRERIDFFGIERLNFIWGSDCKVKIGHVIIHDIYPAKKKGKSHYEDIMRVGIFDGTSDILAANSVIVINSDPGEIDSLVERINVAFKLLLPTSTGGYIGFRKNESSVHLHPNLRVPIFCLNLNQAARVSPVACLRSI